MPAGFTPGAREIADHRDVATFGTDAFGRRDPLNVPALRLELARRSPLEVASGQVVPIDAEPYSAHAPLTNPVCDVILPLLARSAPGHLLAVGNEASVVVARQTASGFDWWKTEQVHDPARRVQACTSDEARWAGQATDADLLASVWPITQRVDRAIKELLAAWYHAATTPRPLTGSVHPTSIRSSVQPGAPRPNPPDGTDVALRARTRCRSAVGAPLRRLDAAVGPEGGAYGAPGPAGRGRVDARTTGASLRRGAARRSRRDHLGG